MTVGVNLHVFFLGVFALSQLAVRPLAVVLAHVRDSNTMCPVLH